MTIPPRLAKHLPTLTREGEKGIRSLDGVRGMAVLMVLLDHANDDGMQLFTGADVNRLGKYGVYLFFVLSSFLLTYPFLGRSPEALRKPGLWANYLVRRFLRVIPLYVLILLYVTWDGDLSLSQLTNHLLLRDGKWQFWSIPVEFKYYFILPFVAIAFVLLNNGRWWAALAAASATALAVKFLFFPLEEAWSVREQVLLSETLPAFLFGSLAGAAYWHCTNRGGVRPGAKRWCEAIAAACLVAMALRIPAVYEAVIPNAREVGKFGNDPIFCGIVWSIFLVSYLNGTGYIRKALEWAPLCYLGLISYSAYLCHREFLNEMDDISIPSFPRLLLFLIMVIAVSTVTYVLVEKPLSGIRLAPKRNPVILPESEAVLQAGEQKS